MHNFTPWSALLGGALIGLSASLLLLLNGRTAGISGIVAGVLNPRGGEFTWRLLFVVGLLLGGVGYSVAVGQSFQFDLERSGTAIGIAGLLVGFGSQLGNGCTSGHGVCGMSSLRVRSVVHVCTFIATGALTVYLVRLLGGVL